MEHSLEELREMVLLRTRKNRRKYLHLKIVIFSSLKITVLYISRVMTKPAFCICENKDADQLRGNREADQRLCFRYTDSTIPLLSKSEISSLMPSSVAVQTGLCLTRSETPKTGFLTTRLILHRCVNLMMRNHD